MKPLGLQEVFHWNPHGFFQEPADAERVLSSETGPDGLLRRMGVDGLVVSERFDSFRPSLLSYGWKETAEVKGGRVYQRGGPPSPRAYAVTAAEIVAAREAAADALLTHGTAPAPSVLLPSAGQVAAGEKTFAPAQVSVIEDGRNSMTVDVASAPGEGEVLVVFARPWFPGYRAVCDGKPVPVEVYDLFLPAVRLPAGTNGRVVLEYWPTSLTVGLWLAGTTSALLGAGRRHGRRPAIAAPPRRPAPARPGRAAGACEPTGLTRKGGKAMKVVLLCGGQGTRLREETEYRPKPMVEIGGRPILWHIMKLYAHHGFREFVLCLGYRGNMIKEYFLNYEAMNNDFTICLGPAAPDRLPRRPRRAGLPRHPGRHRPGDHDRRPRPAHRALRRRRHLHGHLRRRRRRRRHPGAARLPPRPRPARHGHRRPARPRASASSTWPTTAASTQLLPRSRSWTDWVNAGFFVFNRRVFDYLDGDECILEREPLERLAAGRAADGLPARRLLLRDGHVSRVQGPERPLGRAARPRGRCGNERLRSGKTGRRWSRGPRAWWAAGWSAACSTPAPTSSAWCATGCPRLRVGPRPACSTGSSVVRGDVRDQALLERTLGEYEIDTRHPPGGPDDRRHRQPQPGFDLRDQHPRHLGAAGGLPPQPGRQADRRGLVGQGLRRPGETALRRETPARRAGTPTTSASRAPT